MGAEAGECQQPACRSNPFWGQVFSANPRQRPRRVECPLSREQLGHYSWSFLHTLSMAYPDAPSPAQQAAMEAFLGLFAELYPCGICAPHFQRLLRAQPPRVASREELAVWLCQAHNDTSRRLGKPEWDCDFAKLRLRWERNPACERDSVLD